MIVVITFFYKEMNNKQKFAQQIPNTKVAPIKNEKKVKPNRPKVV